MKPSSTGLNQAPDSGDVTPWVRWFVGCVEQACLATVAQVQGAARKTAFWATLQANHPQLSASQRKVLNKLYDFGPDGFANGLSTEKYTAIAQVSRATAYRELTDLVAQGVLVKSGVGRGTRYALVGDGVRGFEGSRVRF